jgi:site-specific DNA-methyltransferase (adenine-specific)
MIKLTNECNMELMKRYPDKHFNLAIVDPPYGILSKMGDRLEKYGNDFRKWDENVPDISYFKELRRVSKHQIICGGNYFPHLWTINQKSFIFWYKHQPIQNWAAGELMWTSHTNKTAKCFDYMQFGGVNQDKNRFHPTQKPISFYEFCLMEYAEEGDLILDTHLGSGGIAVACHNLGYDLVGCEIATTYFDKTIRRLKEHQAQTRMF